VHGKTSQSRISPTQSRFMNKLSTSVSSKDVVKSSLEDVDNLATKFEDMVESHYSEHAAEKSNFDFLDVKNTLYTSYIIDLIKYIDCMACRSSDCENEVNERELRGCLVRLNEMRVVLDKIRPMEKKLAYQLQKLVGMADNFAKVARNQEINEDVYEDNEKKDPLSFRPDMAAMDSEEENIGEGIGNTDDMNSSSEDDSEEYDPDLKAAKDAASSSRAEMSERKKIGVYKAPRLSAIPYENKDTAIAKSEKAQQRQVMRMRNSEVLQTLRYQYSDRPEEDDIYGGAKLGTTKAAARKMAAKEAEKLDIEESNFIRLGVNRKDRKAKKQMEREETSNLKSLADLGSLTSGFASFERNKKYGRESKIEVEEPSLNPRPRKRKSKNNTSERKAKNTLKSLAFGGVDNSSGKKKKNRQRK